MNYPRVASFKTAAAFRAHLERIGAHIGFDDELAAPGQSPLGHPFVHQDLQIGNRFCILPMEGWDGTVEGAPSELTARRWRRFGTSGAKLIWGGEAVAVRQDGRANPNQLLMTPCTQRSIADLRDALVTAHRERFGANADRDLYIGLQLTHSGRYARPHGKSTAEPLAAYAHPLLDRRFGHIHILSDDELDRIADAFVEAARLAADAGFAFVDVKHCHGYLGHELLSARSRTGPYGGDLHNRTRLLRSVVSGIRAVAPTLEIAVRVSAFDTVPFRKAADDLGQPEADSATYDCAFGALRGSVAAALADCRELLGIVQQLGIRLVCITAGSPYYNPHIQRPALFPPSDGYTPPEDPLIGVARHLEATALLKAAFPSLVFVGSAYSYLQEWLPHVAQHAVRMGKTDFVGLGRVALAYPELAADVLAGTPLNRKAICRTFSDCTTGPRFGLVSGCYPLDAFYTSHEDGVRLRQLKASRS